MSDSQQAQDQLSALFSQRFSERETALTEVEDPERVPRKRGRPPKAVKRKTVSFFILPEILVRLDDAYYLFNVGLSKETRMSRAEFREMLLEKGLDQHAYCGLLEIEGRLDACHLAEEAMRLETAKPVKGRKRGR